ncbi:MAG: proline--tRNA ligase [Acidobacteria bacterium]|nr:proline--tRNA ligase [Acidobacteriota bacterium]
MRWSQAFIPTLRESPADVESPSHRLLVRAGFIRRLGSGLYAYLPPGQRSLLKIAGIIRAELGAAGAQEFFLPLPHRHSVGRDTGGPARSGDGLSSVEDRSGPASAADIPHEAAFTELFRREIRSYRELPQVWYQIHAGLCDELRLKPGPRRLRQSLRMDSCSFDRDPSGLDRSYRLHYDLLCRTFTRCGLKVDTVEASSAGTDCSQSVDFVVRMGGGEDCVISCSCGYAANLECATSRISEVADEPACGAPRRVPTPGQKTISEVAAFLGAPATHQIKSLVYIAGDKPYLFLLRGDHQLNEAKIRAFAGNMAGRQARPDEIRELFGADAGSLGPVGISGMPIVADYALRGRQNMTCGANQDDFHLQGVTPDVHFRPVWADLRAAEPGEDCSRCGRPLGMYRATRIGYLRKLATASRESGAATVLDAEGKQVPVAVGNYGIDLERILSSVVELCHDDDGIIWPGTIAPFAVVLTPVNYRESVKAAADKLYEEMQGAQLEVLLDDRQERPGVKFKDADLVGIPYRVVLGAEKVSRGQAELFERASRKTELVDLASVIPALQSRLLGSVPV